MSGARGNAQRQPAPRGGTPRVVVASDVRLYREGLAASLARDGRVAVLAAVAGDRALASVAELAPDAVLVDASGADGLGLARALRAEFPGVRLVGFGIAGGASGAIACAEAGLAAFVDRDGTIETLVEAVGCALRGQLSCSPELAAMLCERIASLAKARPAGPPEGALTRRERQIAALVAEGLSNKEIAIDLSIGPATVKNHVHNILDKLHIRRRAAIAAHVADPARG